VAVMVKDFMLSSSKGSFFKSKAGSKWGHLLLLLEGVDGYD